MWNECRKQLECIDFKISDFFQFVSDLSCMFVHICIFWDIIQTEVCSLVCLTEPCNPDDLQNHVPLCPPFVLITL